MHPNRAFAWADRDEMLAFVAEIAFCTVAADGPMVVHVPVSSLRRTACFSPSLAEPCKLDCQRASSPAWGLRICHPMLCQRRQVPTWNYLAAKRRAAAPARLGRLAALSTI